jgi:hypothetical protein
MQARKAWRRGMESAPVTAECASKVQTAHESINETTNETTNVSINETSVLLDQCL